MMSFCGDSLENSDPHSGRDMFTFRPPKTKDSRREEKTHQSRLPLASACAWNNTYASIIDAGDLPPFSHQQQCFVFREVL